jgi:hypothetical protein
MNDQQSIPTITEFNPYLVPYQIKVISLIRQEYNYNQGPLEILLSGSVGSAKSLLACHIIATHVIQNPNAGVLIGRRTLKDLKNTIWQMLLRHYPYLRQFWNKSEMTIKLPNGAIIYGVSWDDGNFDKFRSYELSLAVIEELTENDEPEFYHEIRMRVGRARAKENVILSLTNPDSPHHWAYTHFMENGSDTRKVFYSRTEDNPFLPKWYIESLKKNLSEKLWLRMGMGQWIEMDSERIYYAFDDQYNFIDKTYVWDFKYPLDLMFDFNNSKAGKPMSIAAGQFINGKYHIAKTYIMASMRTLDMCDEIADDGLLDLPFPNVRVFGDATGRHSDTRSNRSDWDLIEGFMSNFVTKRSGRLNYDIEVGLSNPPIKHRHNTLNSLFRNVLGQTFMFFYADAKDACKGFRLTQYKTGAKLIENDNLREQHITTSIGYYVCRNILASDDIAPLVIS